MKIQYLILTCVAFGSALTFAAQQAAKEAADIVAPATNNDEELTKLAAELKDLEKAAPTKKAIDAEEMTDETEEIQAPSEEALETEMPALETQPEGAETL